MPTRIQLKRSKGWRMPAGVVKVDRTTIWGNPFRAGLHYDIQHAVDLHRQYLGEAVRGELSPKHLRRLQDEGCDIDKFMEAARRIGELRGKTLACWCPMDSPCHAENLLQLANQ
jgi:Domain of unknown function (DUF4326)